MSNWQRFARLAWAPLLVLLLSVFIVWLLASEAGLRWAWQRATLMLDGQLTASQLSGRLLGPLAISDLQLQQGGVKLNIHELSLDWEASQLLRGRLEFADLQLQGVEIAIAADKDGQAATTLPTELILPLGLVIKGAEIQDIRLLIAGQAPIVVDRLLLDGQWQAHVLQLMQLALYSSWGTVSLQGELGTGAGKESDLTAQWALTLLPEQLAMAIDEPVPLSGQAHISGVFQRPRLRLELQEPSLLHANGELAWQEAPLRWQLEFSLPDVDPSLLQSSWPQLKLASKGHLLGTGLAIKAELSGSLEQAQAGLWGFSGRAVYEDAALKLADWRLQAPADGGEITLQANWPFTDQQAQLALQWQALSHQLLAGWRSDGQLELTGRPESYSGQLSLTAEDDSLPAVEVNTHFSGDLKSVALADINARWMAGVLTGAAALAWQDGLDWHGDVQLKGLALAQLDRRLPAALAGTLKVSGHLQDRLQINLQELSLRSGRARFKAKGELGDVSSLHWQLSADDLAELWSEAGGKARLDGQLAGSLLSPRQQLQGKIEQFKWMELALTQLKLQGDVDLAGVEPWQLDVQLADLGYQGHTLDSIRVQLQGEAENHILNLSMQGMESKLAVVAQGHWQAGQWRAELQRGQLSLPELGDWQAASSQLVWSQAASNLQPWCWRGQGEFCLSLTSEENSWQASVAVSDLPLRLLQNWLPRSGVSVDGHLGGVVVASGEAAQVHEMIVRLGAADTQLQYRLPEEVVKTELTTLQLYVDGDDAGLRSRLLVVGDGGQAELNIKLPKWLPGQPLADEQILQGQLELSADQLVWLSYLEPNLLQPAGRLHASVQLLGTIAEPVLRGELGLSDGDVLIPAAGIHLRGIELQGLSSDGRSLSLQGKMMSGSGNLLLDGQLLAEQLDQWRVEMSLRGENFELVRRVQARALVSPDLQITVQTGGLEQRGLAGKIDVSGQLVVPQADINLPRLSTTVSTSADELILDAEEDEALPGRWQLGLDLSFIAGERVHLEGYGFSGRLAGEVRARGQSLELVRAQGEMNVHDGRYEAYGQNLRIQHGRLLFVDSPLDNPGLDVRAVRGLPEQAQIVGVEVSGRLKTPRLRLFSEPLLEESEALAWLVLGRPLNTASGNDSDALYRAAFMLGGGRAARGIALQFGLDEVSMEQGVSGEEAALVLGKYLSPRLYLQYAVGLWEAGNQLRLRYKLGANWNLSVEQGREQSGADLQYVIER